MIDLTHLIRLATEASQRAYVPYSHYHVGAALLGESGTVYTGCNVENASYPITICAERTALVKAVSEGERSFQAIAVVTRNGGTPCGMCRQMLFEFAPDLRVIVADEHGQVVVDQPLSVLLPYGFGPAKLES